MNEQCPNCGYPAAKESQHYKGIYTPGQACPYCKFIDMRRTKMFVPVHIPISAMSGVSRFMVVNVQMTSSGNPVKDTQNAVDKVAALLTRLVNEEPQ